MNVGERMAYPLVLAPMLLALSDLHQHRISTVDDAVERDSIDILVGSRAGTQWDT